MAKKQSGAFAARWKASDGEDGKGIASTEIRYQIGDSGTIAPTGTWLETPPAPVKGKYLWTRTIIIYTDGTFNQFYSVSYYALDGTQGMQGPVPIRKKWVVGDTHHKTDMICDYIYVERGSKEDSDWYMLKENGTKTAGSAPAKSLTTAQLTTLGYEKITSYMVLATDVFIANEANVAGLIMKDFAFWSQKGRRGNNEVDYDGKTGFEPYFIIDGKTGEAKFTKGTFEGSIIAKEGNIGKWIIDENGLKTTAAGGGQLNIEVSGTRFLRMNNTTTGAFMSIRNDGYMCLSLSTYGTQAGANIPALSIINNSGGSGLAIESTGGHLFRVRSGEKWNAPGVLYITNTVVESQGGTNNGGAWQVSDTTFTMVRSNGRKLSRITHNLGHTEYGVLIVVHGQDTYGTAYNRTNSYFDIEFNSKVDAGHFVTIIVVGRNKNP